MNTAICIPCDKNYLPGLEVLLFSLYHHNPLPLNILIISEDIDYGDIPLQHRANTGINLVIHRPDVDKYKDIPINGRFPRVVYYTWEALNLGYDRLIFIGADQLIVGDISEAWTTNTHDFCAMKENAGIQSDNICTGMLMVNPKAFPNLYDQWMSLASQGESYDSGDQGVINSWVKKNNIDVHYLDKTWDVSKRLFRKDSNWWNDNATQFKSIHFVGSVKPWMGDEQGYEKLHEYYRQYMNQNVQAIPLF